MPSLSTFDPRFPVGKFRFPKSYTQEEISEWIRIIEEFPDQLRSVTKELSKEQLNLRYREGGWTVKQVVHHCADSHMNSFIRFKLGLTEDSPLIKPYHENLWGELPDGNLENIESSLKLIEGLHARWVVLLKSMSEDDLDRTLSHPEFERKLLLKQNIALYAWHCRHHLAHIKQALDQA